MSRQTTWEEWCLTRKDGTHKYTFLRGVTEVHGDVMHDIDFVKGLMSEGFKTAGTWQAWSEYEERTWVSEMDKKEVSDHLHLSGVNIFVWPLETWLQWAIDRPAFLEAFYKRANSAQNKSNGDIENSTATS